MLYGRNTDADTEDVLKQMAKRASRRKGENTGRRIVGLPWMCRTRIFVFPVVWVVCVYKVGSALARQEQQTGAWVDLALGGRRTLVTG